MINIMIKFCLNDYIIYYKLYIYIYNYEFNRQSIIIFK